MNFLTRLFTQCGGVSASKEDDDAPVLPPEPPPNPGMSSNPHLAFLIAQGGTPSMTNPHAAFCLASASKVEDAPATTTQPNMSLWLVPPPDAAAALSAQIEKMAADFGGPKFAPHATVLGSVGALTPEEAGARLKKLGGSGAVPLEFEPACASGLSDAGEAVWNQGAVALVVESEPLLALLKLARSEFLGVEPDAPVVWSPPLGKPHVSLAYGCSADLAAKLDVPAGFTCTEIALVQTEPATLAGVPTWCELARVTL
jgi:hypothetical protein